MDVSPRRSLAVRLALALLAGCLAVYLLILLDVHEGTRRMLEERIRREGTNLIDAAAARIDAELARVSETPARVAEALAKQQPERGAIERMLCDAVSVNRAVFGAAVAFDTGAFAPDVRHFSPYCFREGGALRLKDLGQGGYDYPSRDWYRLPKESGRPAWSEPYFDEGGGGVLMATYSIPVFRRGETDGRVVAVATADVALEWLQQFMSEVRAGRRGYAFLVSGSGGVVTHPDSRLAMKATLAGLAAERGDPGLTRLAAAVVAGEAGFERMRDLATDAPSFVVFRPLRANGWHLVAVVPEREALADVEALRTRMLLTGAAGALALGLVVVLLSRGITLPLVRLSRAAREVAAGRLDAPLPLGNSEDEVGRLTASFAEMQTALSLYIDDVKRKAGVEERLESELRIARQIQMSLLPRAADLRPERLGCEIFGLLEPARAVGGDLFDVVVRRPGEVAFVIGDVSDKGIPAALFMAMTDIHFEAAVRDLGEPEAILERINDALVAENSANMFVTLACGVLETATGRLRLASGGHTRPVLLPRLGPPRYIEDDVGTVVGVLAGLEFQPIELHLEAGDALLLYTDGVTEAHDTAGRMFGEERLLAHLTRHPEESVGAIAEGLREAVGAFSGTAPQFDDIAILVVRRLAAVAVAGPVAPATGESAAVLEIASAVSELPRARGWLDEWCAAQHVAEEARHDLDVALDEVVANVIHHGYGSDASGSIRLRLTLLGDHARFEVSDRAPAFNPIESSEPGAGAADGEGGLGVHLVRRLMDRVEYVRENGENRLILERRRDGRKGSGVSGH